MINSFYKEYESFNRYTGTSMHQQTCKGISGGVWFGLWFGVHTKTELN